MSTESSECDVDILFRVEHSFNSLVLYVFLKTSTSLAIGVMQIKINLRFHLTPVRMAKIKQKKNKTQKKKQKTPPTKTKQMIDKCWYKSEGRGTLIYFLWKNKPV